MFKRKSEPSCIWSFECKTPSDGLDYARDQLRLAHQYRNKLVEIERNRRVISKQIAGEHTPEFLRVDMAYTLADEAVEKFKKERKKQNSLDRKRSMSKEDRTLLQKLKAEKSRLKKELAVIKPIAYHHPDAQPQQDELNKQTTILQKKARAESGLYFGTYCQVEWLSIRPASEVFSLRG